MVRLSDTVEKTMFYGAKPITFERAKELRRKPTDTERMMWEILRNKKMLGLRFKHQHPISIFIADFYCHPIKLVIEVDGKIHESAENKEYDKNRTAELERFGIKVIRFTNNQIVTDISSVIKEVELRCKELMKNINSNS